MACKAVVVWERGAAWLPELCEWRIHYRMVNASINTTNNIIQDPMVRLHQSGPCKKRAVRVTKEIINGVRPICGPQLVVRNAQTKSTQNVLLG